MLSEGGVLALTPVPKGVLGHAQLAFEDRHRVTVSRTRSSCPASLQSTE